MANTVMTLAEFARMAASLKEIKRAGWQDKFAMTDGESVADHSYSATVIAMTLSDAARCDTGRVMKMAILHDLAESKIGDIIPGRMPDEKKLAIESAAFRDIAALLPDDLKTEYVSIWSEFCAGKTLESRIVRQADKLDMALQAATYKNQGVAGDSEAAIFVDAARAAIHDESARKMLAEFVTDNT